MSIKIETTRKITLDFSTKGWGLSDDSSAAPYIAIDLNRMVASTLHRAQDMKWNEQTAHEVVGEFLDAHDSLIVDYDALAATIGDIFDCFYGRK